MKKNILAIILILTSILTLSACSDDKVNDNGSDTGAGENRELNLFTWEGMFPVDVIDNFSKETGIKVNYSNFDFDETMFAKVQADNQGIYDLVIADDYIIQSIIEEGLAQKLDLDKIPNHKNINEVYQGQFFDPTDEYTVPYGSGVQTIIYNPDLIDFKIEGYEDLWNEELKDSLGIIGNHRVINGMALKILGESYNTEDLDVIRESGKLLNELVPNIRLIKDDNLQDDLISGEIAASIMYTSQITMAKLAVPELEVVFPKEGIGFGIMANFIPAKAKNYDEAHEFINYILTPEVSAKCFENLGYYTTNKASEEFINEEYKSFLTLPDEFDISKAEMIEPISVEAEEVHSEVWTAFKLLQE